MTAEQLYQVLGEIKFPYIRVTDMYKNLLFKEENFTNVDKSIQKLKEILPLLSSYGKVTVTAASQTQKDASYKGAASYIVDLSPVQAPALGTGAVEQPGMPWQIPAGYIPASTMEAHLSAINGKIEMLGKINALELQLANKSKPVDEWDRIEKIMPYAAPFVLSAMGKSMAEIKELTTLAGTAASMSRVGNSATMQAPVNALSFDDLKNLSIEEKNKRIDELMTVLTSKVSAEQMIMLIDLLNKDQQNINHAIRFLACSVEKTKLVQLIQALEKNPTLADAALTFLNK